MSDAALQLCLALAKRIVLAARAAKHNRKNVDQARARGGAAAARRRSLLAEPGGAGAGACACAFQL